ncbi:MAG: DNA polymerase I, partial [Clostridia bacterium]|nr:DNA polymerase I [Clostridia bacterium]
QEIFDLTNVPPFNLNSPQQLGKVLFETLGLRGGKKTSRGYSTDAETLEGLRDQHPAIDKILEYRQVVKLTSTYIDALIDKRGPDGRIRSMFDQTGTVTGRISSSEPNLQNIPVRTPMGREIRRAFIPREGWKLCDADYSQIELRVLAHLSGDENMRDAFLRGQDIHARTASEVYGVPMDEVTGEMRRSAKAVNFGLVYGISEFGLARNLGISRGEAHRFIERYFERYPGIRAYMTDSVARGKADGYTETLFHRRRPLPELKSPNGNIRSFGERVAMNAPVQGTAADIIKLAMIRVHTALKEKALRARLILQVHDELLIECPPEEEADVMALLKDCMENACEMAVPLTVEVKSGSSWYETK